MTDTLSLNQGQHDAAEYFFSFLFNDEKEMGIDGPGGVGKTFLMSHMIDEIMPRYFDACKLMGIEPKYNEIHMTALTNKAAGVLSASTKRPCITIHSHMNLKVKDDYQTGKQTCTKMATWRVHENMIIFIDECSMISRELDKLIQEGTMNCKIVYVGDDKQVPPVGERISPIYNRNIPFFTLTEQMRNSEQPALMDICTQFRNTVETGEFKKIKVVPGVIDWVPANQMEKLIADLFTNGDVNGRIVGYTNNRVIDYNQHIRDLRQLPDEYQVGETLISNNGVRTRDGMIANEEQLTIQKLGDIQVAELPGDIKMEYRIGDLLSHTGKLWTDIKIPTDITYFRKLCDYYAKKRDFHTHFNQLKNVYPDLRPKDASTVHKSQGSTFDWIIIDLNDIGTCRNPDLAARLLYVALSRARTRIYLYGDLPEKFGGVIQ